MVLCEKTQNQHEIQFNSLYDYMNEYYNMQCAQMRFYFTGRFVGIDMNYPLFETVSLLEESTV